MNEPTHARRRAAGTLAILGFALVCTTSATAQSWPGIESLAPPPATPGFNQVFGADMAISGEWAAVGDPGWSFLYMYRRGDAGWEYVQCLEGTLGSWYGTSVAMDGHTMVVGLRHYGWPDIGSGRVWVYMRTGGGWFKTHELMVPEFEDRANFGYSVDIEGDVIAVGAPFHDVGPNEGAGAIVVFERSGAHWERTALLPWTPCCPGVPNAHMGGMGYSISLSGDRIAAGAPVSLYGEVYLFERIGGLWGRSAVIVDHVPDKQALFGIDVAIHGDRLLVGKPRVKDINGWYYPGQAYFYEYDPNSASWELDILVQASDGHGGPEAEDADRFGWRVEMVDERAFVSATYHIGHEVLDGKAYALKRDPVASWVEVEHYDSPLYAVEDVFGRSMAVSERYLLVGTSPEHADERTRSYAFERTLGVTYCEGGGTNVLSLLGSPAIADGALDLAASELSPGARSVFLFGPDPAFLPFQGGHLCLGPVPKRVGPFQVVTASAKVVQPVDFTVPPLVAFVAPGATLHFQHWTRVPGQNPQLSNAVSVELE